MFIYLQITTQCNMTCAHCSFSCGVGYRYEEMSWETFCYGLDLAEELGLLINIGGGEPTLHPEFWRMLQEALRTDIESVWLATNGKKTEDSIALAILAGDEGYIEYEMWLRDRRDIPYPEDQDDEGAMEDYYLEVDNAVCRDKRINNTCPEDWEKFECALSKDAYHAPINELVVSAFSSRGHELRDNTYHLSNIGAAKKNRLYAKDTCACNALFVTPDGTVKMCGCPDSLVLGHVSDKEKLIEIYERISETEEEHGECGYFGLRHAKSDEEVENWKIRRYLTTYILTGKDPKFKYTDPVEDKAA